MAGICIACKSTLHSTDVVVSLCHGLTIANISNTNRFVSDRQVFCHRSCFVCSACNSPLQEKFSSYSISGDEQLFCLKHSGTSEDELLLRALTDFKAKSLALKSALEHESDQDLEAVEKPDKEVGCACNKPQLVEPAAGYWVECVESNCVKSTSFLNRQDNQFNGLCDLGSSRTIERVTSVSPEEFYRQYFYGVKHWNYCAKEEEIGPVFLSIKSDSTSHLKGHFRVIVRSSYYLLHGLLPVPNHHNGHSDHEEMVQLMAQQMGLVSPLKLITAPSAPADLLKMDTAFTKKAYKFGVVYMMEGQQTEEEMFGNETHSKAFDEFLDLLGERVRLRGFNRYRAGLDGNNDLTGKYSVYTTFANKEIMFHVSTLLPFEETDPQKLQRKRHIGNDIVCIVFMDATQTKFIPRCIKSNFLHSFIVVQVDFTTNPDLYTVSVVSKDDVPFYGPPLSEKHTFQKNSEFRDWILRKLIQGEQACHRAPNFARLHARTRSQIMDQLLKRVEESSGQKRSEDRKAHKHSLSLSGHQENDVIMDKVVRDFSSTGAVRNREDKVAFLVGTTNKRRFIAVKSVVARKSKVFCNMFFKDLTQGTTYQDTPKADWIAPVVKRTISWTRSNPSLHEGIRSGKFNLEKIRRHKSDSDSAYDSVTLASVTDLENKNNDRLPTLHCQQIVIQEFEPDVFEAVLEFVHSGSCDLSPSLLAGVLCAAEHYKVDDLQHVCAQRLQQCISGQIACDMLNYLDRYPHFPRADVVREKIVELVSHVSPSILQCSGFADLSEESVQLILSTSHLVSKTVLFHSILEWAKTYSKKNGCERTVEELTQPLIHKIINTQQISAHELQEVVQLSGLVPNDAVNLALRVKMQRDSITDTHC